LGREGGLGTLALGNIRKKQDGEEGKKGEEKGILQRAASGGGKTLHHSVARKHGVTKQGGREFQGLLR